MMLADHGARVIKVEPSTGESVRFIGYGHKERAGAVVYTYCYVAANKSSARFDYRSCNRPNSRYDLRQC